MKDTKSRDIIATLVGADPVSYGPDHQKHLLEIYKEYTQTVERVSDRRQKANSFFLSINTAIIALIGYVQSLGGADAASAINLLVPPAGVIICYTWYRVLRSYGGVNAGKFDVILALEDFLPVCPFRAEWKALGEGQDPKCYKPLGKLEAVVPWVFLIIHLAVITLAVYKRAFTGIP
jgi:hypothetical protein